MMLTRHKPKSADARIYLITVLSLLILVCEIAYLNWLNAKETHKHQADTSIDLVSITVSMATEPTKTEDMEQQTSNHKRFASADAIVITPTLFSRRLNTGFCDLIEFEQDSQRR